MQAACKLSLYAQAWHFAALLKPYNSFSQLAWDKDNNSRAMKVLLLPGPAASDKRLYIVFILQVIYSHPFAGRGMHKLAVAQVYAYVCNIIPLSGMEEYQVSLFQPPFPDPPAN